MSRRFLLPASLALNVALAGVGVWLAKNPAPGASASPRLHLITNRPVRLGAATASTPTPPTVVVVPAAFDWSQVAATNLAQYATNLRAIECPAEIRREIILAVVNEDFARCRHAIFATVHARFWELMVQPGSFRQEGREDRGSDELRTERNDRLQAALGTTWRRDADPSPVPVYYHEPTLSFLPEEKQQRWSELDENFVRRQQDIYHETPGNAAEQKAQLEAIAKERDEARHQLLTAGELQEYTARTSSQAGWAQNLAGFEATEEEYRALNQLRAATPTNQIDQFRAQAQALLGEERLAGFQRARDPRFAELLALAGRCQLPLQTIELIYQQRVSAEQQCALVRSNPALPADARRALLLAIQSETRQQLLGGLGQTAGEAYLRHHGNWLEAMNRVNQP